ncbi:hypothetical protein PM082_013283 [Marasmius tenuissimus]|nr:hypothetical protein PM082_013283 [Marasmius tenuissimus]
MGGELETLPPIGKRDNIDFSFEFESGTGNADVESGGCSVESQSDSRAWGVWQRVWTLKALRVTSPLGAVDVDGTAKEKEKEDTCRKSPERRRAGCDVPAARLGERSTQISLLVS